MDTETEIREMHEQETNETPDLADEQGDGDLVDDDGGGIDLPVPSLTRTQVAIIGAVVAAIIAWRLYQARQSGGGSGGSAGELADVAGSDMATEVDAAEAAGEQDDEIRVPKNNRDPLAGDEAVAEAFRNRGLIEEEEG